jgi:putative MATE family efflux protein
MANHSLMRIVWQLSLPIILVEATETLDHLIDTLFLARVGVTELGAIGVADTVLLLFLVVPLSTVHAMQILTARRVGQRRPRAVGMAFNQGLLVILALSLACLVGLKMFSPVLADWIVESEAVGKAVNSYLQLDAYSIPLAGLTFAYSALLTSLGRTWALIPTTLIVIVSDIVLNYLFIFGKFGCPALGMRGAAVGSIGAELAAAIFLTIYTLRTFNRRDYGFFQFRSFDARITRSLRNLASPLVVQGFLRDLRWFVFFLIIERMGTAPLAVANIVFTCYLVFCVPTEGFAETVCSMVSRFIGKNRTGRIGEVLRSATGGAMLTTLPFIVLAFLAPQWLLAAFAPGEALLGQSYASLRVVALAMLIAIPAEMWFTAVEGTGDTLAALGIDLLLTLVMLGVAYCGAICFAWPISLVWTAAPVTWLVGLAASYAWMRSGFWKRLEV